MLSGPWWWKTEEINKTIKEKKQAPGSDPERLFFVAEPSERSLVDKRESFKYTNCIRCINTVDRRWDMIILDYKDRRPIYEQVTEKLQELILCGILEEDSQLPSVRSLATQLSINPNTIQRAYAELERKGFIYSVKGKGSFVADASSIKALKTGQLRRDLNEWMRQARNAGITEDKIHRWIAEDWTKIMPEGGEL